jgi:hypothetical protein
MERIKRDASSIPFFYGRLPHQCLRQLIVKSIKKMPVRKTNNGSQLKFMINTFISRDNIILLSLPDDVKR